MANLVWKNYPGPAIFRTAAASSYRVRRHKSLAGPGLRHFWTSLARDGKSPTSAAGWDAFALLLTKTWWRRQKAGGTPGALGLPLAKGVSMQDSNAGPKRFSAPTLPVTAGCARILLYSDALISLPLCRQRAGLPGIDGFTAVAISSLIP